MSRQRPHTSPISIIFLIICIIIIISLIKSAFEFRRAKGRLQVEKAALEQLLSQKKLLQDQVQSVQDPAAVDMTIRDKFNVARPGETVVVITNPETAFLPVTSSPKPTPSLSPLRQWWYLVVHPE